MDEKENLSEEERAYRAEAAKNITKLLHTLKKMEKEMANMTEEEKKRNEWGAWDGDTLLYKY